MSVPNAPPVGTISGLQQPSLDVKDAAPHSRAPEKRLSVVNTEGGVTHKPHCCTEKRASCVLLVATLAVALIGTIFLISLHHHSGAFTPFFTRVREFVGRIATHLHTSSFDVTLFILVMGGIGTVGCFIWRAKVCCVEANVRNSGGSNSGAQATEGLQAPAEGSQFNLTDERDRASTAQTDGQIVLEGGAAATEFASRAPDTLGDPHEFSRSAEGGAATAATPAPSPQAMSTHQSPSQQDARSMHILTQAQLAQGGIPLNPIAAEIAARAQRGAQPQAGIMAPKTPAAAQNPPAAPAESPAVLQAPPSPAAPNPPELPSVPPAVGRGGARPPQGPPPAVGRGLKPPQGPPPARR